MITKPKSTASKKTPTKKKKPGKLLGSRFKFNKIVVLALAAILSIAGAVYVFTSQASSSVCPSSNGVVQCGWNSPGIKHQAGGDFDGTFTVDQLYWTLSNGEKYFTTRNTWKAYYNSDHNKFEWQGPYATITVPQATIMQACFQYAHWATGSIYFDVTAYKPNTTTERVLASQTVKLRASGILYHGATNGDPWYELQTHCMGVNLDGGTYRGVELRLKSTSDPISGETDIYKTYWQLFY